MRRIGRLYATSGNRCVIGITLAAAILLLFLTSCADVKTGLTQAAQNIDAFLGVEREYDTESISTDVEALYRQGLEFKEAARHRDAAARFFRAGNHGHMGAAYEMGLAYNEGRGVAKDPKRGERWFRTAADGGDARAQFIVGAKLYADGADDRSYAQAIDYLTGAANQGHSRAQFVLGEAYANGRGVMIDVAWAARWYAKAGAQGHTRAQFSIGVFRTAGLGVSKDSVAAYTWLSLAADKGHEDAAAMRDSVSRNLTAAEITRARARAAGFEPQPPTAFADGPTIVYVQQALSALGYAVGDIDGVPGTRTRSAISDYQAKAGLMADGVITPELVERLFADSHQKS